MKPLLFSLALLSLLIGIVTLAYAQVNNSYNLSWYTVDGGGNRLAGGSFVMLSTAGQPEAGSALSGGDFRLNDGFWAGGASAIQYAVFLPLIMRN